MIYRTRPSTARVFFHEATRRKHEENLEEMGLLRAASCGFVEEKLNLFPFWVYFSTFKPNEREIGTHF